MEKKFYFFIFLFLFIVIIFSVSLKITSNRISKTEIKELDNPEIVIENLYKAIAIAEEKGEYKCCVEPACTMCYLGHWKFEKGTCYCDDKIIEGKNEDVCPECIAGIEKGLCSSKLEDCILNEEIYGGK